MPPGLPLENDRQRVHQEAVDALLELVADQKRDEDRADRPHQPVAQLDQVIEERHPAFFEFGFPVVVHNGSLKGAKHAPTSSPKDANSKRPSLF